MRRIFFAECLITDSPSVTWPSPANTTVPLRRTHKTVVERISLFFAMSVIFDYSSANGALSEARQPTPIQPFTGCFGNHIRDYRCDIYPPRCGPVTSTHAPVRRGSLQR